jgi:hypothetical protein
MKFNVLGASLWTGIKQVLDLTRSAAGSYEFAIETDEHDIIVHRNNSHCRAQYRLPAYVEEQGKVIVADVSPLEFHENDLVLEYTGKSRILVTGVDIKTKLVKSSTDPDNFQTIEPQGDFYLLPKAVKRTLWLYDNLDMPIYIANDTVMAREGGIVFSWYRDEPTITPLPCVMLASTINLISDSVMLQVAEEAIWLKTDNLTAKLSYSYSPWDGSTFLDRLPRTGNWCRVKKSELYSVMQYAFSLSKSQTFTKGLIYLELNDDQIIVTTAAEGAGQGKRSLEIIESEGVFKMKMYPQQLMQALSAADSDEILLEKGGHGLLITGDKIISGIGEIPSSA